MVGRMKEYNFINMSGEIETITNLKKFGDRFGVYALDWATLCTWRPSEIPNKEHKTFLDKYNLRLSLFNVACLQGLGRVFIYPTKLKELKGGNLKK